MTATQLLARLSSVGLRLWVSGDALHYEATTVDVITPTLRAELRRHKPELIKLLTALRRTARPEALIAPVPDGTVVPPSFTQQRFLFLERLQGTNAAYNLSSAFRLTGELDAGDLAWAVREIVARHHVLRTRFDFDGETGRQIVTDFRPELPVVDLSALDGPERERTLQRLLRREAERPFDVAQGPHVRTILLRLEAEVHVFAVCLHHIVSDGVSIRLFVDELRRLYDAARDPDTAPPADLPIQYRDFTHWLYSSIDEVAVESQLAFWRTELSGAPDVLDLPFDQPRPPVQSYRGGYLQFAFDDSFQDRLTRARRLLGATAFHLLFATFAFVLGRYTRQSTLVVGTPVANRDRAETEHLIGPFLNMLAIPVRLAEAATPKDLIRQVADRTVAALDHADVPFERVVQTIAPRRSASYPPLFQAMFALEDAPIGLFDLSGLKVETLTVEDRAAKYDITLIVQRRGDRPVGLLKYNADLFAPETAERLAGHFRRVAELFLADSGANLRDLCLLTAAEREHQLVIWNRTDRPYPYERCLHSFFEEQVRRTPEATAVDAEEGTLTYTELNVRANRLAHLLIAKGVGLETIVGISLERSLAMVVATLAVLKAGGAYVPIDPEYPHERQLFMLDDADVGILLTSDTHQIEASAGCEVLAVDGEAVAAELLRQPADEPDGRSGPGNPCYVIYTSGSTGSPKAVVTEHRAISNNLLWMQDNWPIGPDDVVLLKSSFSFDVSVKEIMWPLMTGARLVVARPGGQRDPVYLYSVIAAKSVTVVHLVPTMLAYVLRQATDAAGQSLRIVMCGGEALPAKLRDDFLSTFDADLLHLYGPTEAAIAVTGGLLNREDADGRITLGRPMANVQIYLLDDDGNPVPVGVPGELCIGGVALARGYHRRPALTAERFVPDPFSGRPGARLYLTGDLARYWSDGSIEYLGRIDRQIKIRGLRVEPGELEAALRDQPEVLDAVVLAIGDGASADQHLVAYITAAPGRQVDDAALLACLRVRLPAHMLPSRITTLDALPIGPNGKVDVAALPRPEVGRPADAIVPQLDQERRIAGLWAEVLGLERVGLDDNFFDLGGHSMLAVELQARLNSLPSVTVAVSELFLYPTVRSLARHMNGDAAPAASVLQTSAERRLEGNGANDGIAIIGMAGRFPGADDIEAYWQNLVAGIESIRFFDDRELQAAGVDPALLADARYVKARGVISPLEAFDADFFGLTPRQAEILDPQIRLLLECGQHALEDAGWTPEAAQRRHAGGIGVFVGVSRSSYALNNLLTNPEVLARYTPMQVAMATEKSYAATRLSYLLDLRGPSVAVDTACSSSLVAVHQACQAIRRGECAMALAGGASVDVPLAGGYIQEEGNIGAVDGHCRPFDAAASGTVKGTGGGLVLLKAHAAALADGDHVQAVILGSATNNDGAAKVGFTAPSADGQAAVIARALADAGIPAESVGYVEAHGTGTALGDPVEVAALSRVFKSGNVALGAVKANIGHLDAASGIAGLIKTTLSLHHSVLPPSINYTRPNPEINFDASPFHVDTERRDWHRSADAPRRAGVSSFGIGGTNVHVVLEEAGDAAREEDDAEAAPVDTLVTLSAATPEALRSQAATLAARLRRPQAPSTRDAAFTLNIGRPRLSVRTSRVCRTSDELLAWLDSLRDGAAGEIGDAGRDSGRLAFLLPGQDAPCVGAARDFYRDDPVVRECLDHASAVLKPELDLDLREILCRETLPAALAARAEETVVRQPAVFALGYALVRAIESRGVRADCFLGHSLGELLAACLAGVFELDDALRLVAARGRLMQACPGGAMLAVRAAFANVADALPPECAAAAFIGPSECVIAGPEAAIERARERLRGRDVATSRLPVRHAFHTELMAPAADQFADHVRKVALQLPQRPYFSNVTGDWATGAEATEPAYWGRQIRLPVHFDAHLRHLLADPDLMVLLEVATKPGLARLARRHPEHRGQPVLDLASPRDGCAERGLLELSGRLWEAGAAIDWERHFADCVPAPRRVPLPGHLFLRSRHWIDPPARRGTQPPSSPAGPRLGTPTWHRLPPSLCRARPHGHWLLITDDKAWPRDLREAGIAVTVVSPAQLDAPSSRPDLWSIPVDVVVLGPDLTAGEAAARQVASSLEVLADACPAARFAVIGRGLFEVYPGEATADGAVALRALPDWAAARAGGLALTLIDAGAAERMAPARLVAALQALEAQTVAVRGRHAWQRVMTWQPAPAVPPRQQPLGGMRFLVTAGLSPVGLAVARFCAEAGASRIILCDDAARIERADRAALEDIDVEIELRPLAAGAEGAARLAENLRNGTETVDGLFCNIVGKPGDDYDGSPAGALAAAEADAAAIGALAGVIDKAGGFGVVLDWTAEADPTTRLYAAAMRSAVAQAVEAGGLQGWSAVDTGLSARASNPAAVRACLSAVAAMIDAGEAVEATFGGAPAPSQPADAEHAPTDSPTLSDEDNGLDQTERRVAELWCHLIGARRYAAGDDFFAVGGDSLVATQLLGEVHGTFGARVGVQAFYAAPTIGGLAAAIKAAGAPSPEPAALDRDRFEL